MDKKEVVEEIIKNIEEELNQSPTELYYMCKDGSIISTDVGFVEKWFDEYKHVLRERYE